MPEQIPLMVDAATQELRQFTSDETIPQGQLLSALQVALTGLVTSDVSGVLASDTILQAIGKLQAQASGKVDKVAGKVLSSNDFTNDERAKLANIAEQATKNATDTALRDRSTHTGTQLAGTISDFTSAVKTTVWSGLTDTNLPRIANLDDDSMRGYGTAVSGLSSGNFPPDSLYGICFTVGTSLDGRVEQEFRAYLGHKDTHPIYRRSWWYLQGWSPWILVLDSTTVTKPLADGGIIERGSNANGEYVKFADGTLICTVELPPVTLPIGGSVAVGWNFPASFITIPTVPLAAVGPIDSHDFIGVRFGYANINNATQYVINGSTVPQGTSGIQLLAIGRWK